jgi:hypothetical protein
MIKIKRETSERDFLLGPCYPERVLSSCFSCLSLLEELEWGRWWGRRKTTCTIVCNSFSSGKVILHSHVPCECVWEEVLKLFVKILTNNCIA